MGRHRTDLRTGQLERPDHVRLGLHLCKGNGTRAWIAEGGYDDVARSVFPHLDGFDVVHMEPDDDRSGGFARLSDLQTQVDKLNLIGEVARSVWN